MLECNSNILSIAITPDGRRAVSGSKDRTLRLWDLDNGQCLHALKGHEGWIFCVGITPDGRYAVSGGEDQSVRVWSLARGQSQQPSQEVHNDSVNDVSITPDGLCAVSVSGSNLRVDDTLRIWNLSNGECLRVLKGHRSWIQCVSVSPDNLHVISGAFSAPLHYWNIENGKCLRTLTGHGSGVNVVRFTADGRYAVSGSDDGTLRVWDLNVGRCMKVIKVASAYVRSLGITPDGRCVVSGDFTGNVCIWDLESGRCIRRLRHKCSVNDIDITPDGRRAVSVSSENTLRVWDLSNGKCLRTLVAHPNAILSLSIFPDGQHAVTGGSDKTLRLWDLAKGRCIAVFASTAAVEAVATHGRDNAICAGTRGGELIFLAAKGLTMGTSIVTATSSGQIRCSDCGMKFQADQQIVNEIQSVCSNLAPWRSPCLHLGVSASANSPLSSHCPHCESTLLVNSFFSDFLAWHAKHAHTRWLNVLWWRRWLNRVPQNS